MATGTMTDQIHMRVNGSPVTVSRGTIVAAALARAGVTRFRRSVLGHPRGPLCGMGICMECRVTINGRPHCRSCQILCEEEMEVMTDAEGGAVAAERVEAIRAERVK
jgi:sarcosine oxidase subunit alpha